MMVDVRGKDGIIAEILGMAQEIPKNRAGSTTTQKEPADSRKDAKTQRGFFRDFEAGLLAPMTMSSLVAEFSAPLRLCAIHLPANHSRCPLFPIFSVFLSRIFHSLLQPEADI
jgi:hypothetical protein